MLLANAGRARYHAVGRGSAAPTPRNGRRHTLRKGVVTGFESRGARPAHLPRRGVTADRPRSTHHAVRTWRGCVVRQLGARSSPRHRSGLDRSNTATSRRRGGLRRLVVTWRAARALFASWSIGRPPAEHARRAVRTWRVCVVGPRRARSSPRRRPGLNRTNIPKVGGMDLGVSWSLRPNPVARGPHASRPVQYRPTAHGACAAQCGLGVGVLWANAGRAPPHVIGRGSTAPTPQQVGGTDFEG